MKQFYSTVFFILLSVLVSAQTGDITGKVHLEDGTPLSNVTVRVVGTEIAGMSNNKGFYTLKNVPFGRQEIRVSSVEIDATTLTLVVRNAKEHLDVHISPKGDITLDEVAVKGMTVKKEMETSGFAVAVIETKEASLRNLTTNELLDRAVGVRVRQNGGVGSQVDYNLNGMSGSTIGVFIDGIETSTYGSSFNLNNIPPSMIERIEVYKGVLPAHLSGNYIGGAINVVMKRDASLNNITAAVSYGSFGTYNGDLSTILRHKKSGFTFRGSGFYTHSDNSYTTWGESTTYVDYRGAVTRPFRAKRFNNEYHSTAGRFEAGFTDVKWADVFFIGYNVSKSYEEVPHGISMATPYVGRFNEAKANVWSLNYNKRDLFVEGLALNVNATVSDRSTYLEDTVTFKYNWDGSLREIIDDGERKPLRKIYTDEFGQIQYEAQQGRPTMSLINRNIINARSNLAYMFMPGHRISLNHKYERTDRDDNNLLKPVPKDLVTTSQTIQNILAFNYETEIWQGRIKTNAQLKYTGDRNNQRKVDFVYPEGQQTINRRDTTILNNNIGYSFALAFKVMPRLYVVTSAENSVVSPTETQRFGEPERNIIPNVELTPERNINYNLGIRTDALERGKSKISLYASAFWRNGYDKIMTQTFDADTIENVDNATLDVTKFINLGMTQARGFEAEVIYVFDNKLNASFNFSKFKNLMKGEFDNQGNPNPYHNELVSNEPYFTINSNVQYRLNNAFQKRSILNLYYNFGFVQEYNIAWRNPDWGVTPAQFAHDLGASYRFPSQKLVVSLDAKNIFNAELYDNFKKQKPGRGIYVKLNYTINKFL
ncbi:TonB-dependent receptor [Sphingobacterium alkalisoli]|uniref:TonB-dependent receptor n=1 Tax=Sphingobacterium alkalisoli TaxID=1874115 RepID=A0A4U0H817_9SPHI|nr:TonB-dependent receptor plug domain-containing protein [Sphingobacterium alkalisoli]TJY67997.1 TonB-dependent receptor [Sphingobacterium alkalisoli]GGH09791.1 TonB-dependent receptor [Sphingobacterium alkalisoli]